jgi:hypothetical protein
MGFKLYHHKLGSKFKGLGMMLLQILILMMNSIRRSDNLQTIIEEGAKTIEMVGIGRR